MVSSLETRLGYGRSSPISLGAFLNMYWNHYRLICCSNGCKFTETGGKLTVKTMLIVPEAKSLDSFGAPITEPVMVFSEGDQQHPLSTSYLTQHNMQHDKTRPPLEYIVVRIEVTDTGVGIRPRDMVESKLFCQLIGSL